LIEVDRKCLVDVRRDVTQKATLSDCSECYMVRVWTEDRDFNSHMTVEQIETVIIGGGQAGLAMSYYLGQIGREHVILERQRVAERWRSERWDSLAFQSPNWNIHLPGFAFQAADPDAFASRDEIVQ
jgi:hypothetical protein